MPRMYTSRVFVVLCCFFFFPLFSPSLTSSALREPRRPRRPERRLQRKWEFCGGGLDRGRLSARSSRGAVFV